MMVVAFSTGSSANAYTLAILTSVAAEGISAGVEWSFCYYNSFDVDGTGDVDSKWLIVGPDRVEVVYWKAIVQRIVAGS